MQAALDGFAATGSRCFRPHWDAFHAVALAAAGDHARAAAVMDGATAAMERTDERYAQPELHRLRGVMLQRSGADAATVEGCHRRAMETARRTGARGWELRAMLSLAACLRGQGRVEEAKAMLESARATLPQLADDRDFVEARRHYEGGDHG
jgi:predicted ATPase